VIKFILRGQVVNLESRFFDNYPLETYLVTFFQRTISVELVLEAKLTIIRSYLSSSLIN